MKKIIPFIAFCLILVVNISSQNLRQDCLITTQSAPDLSFHQNEFTGKTDMFLNDNSNPSLNIIPAMLENKTHGDQTQNAMAQSGTILSRSGAILSANSLIHPQIAVTDVFVITPSNGDQNLDQIEQRYFLDNDALFLSQDEPDPIEKITGFLAIKSCINLHLYISYSNESLIFSNTSLTPANISEYSILLGKWNQSVSGSILIHNLTMAESVSIPDVVEKLEALTGLPVKILRAY